MINELRYEMRDVFPDLPDPLPNFLRWSYKLSQEDIDCILSNTGVAEDQFEKVREVLLWFAFLGISIGEDEIYSSDVNYNIDKIRALTREGRTTEKKYVIHPAFRKALSI
jgi:hypothetical protein